MKRYRAVFLISVIAWVLIFTSACGGKKEISYPPLPEYNIREVEPENNAAIPMTEALKLYKSDTEDENRLFAFYDGDKLWDKKFDKPLQRILEKNKQAFEKLDLAAGRPACVFPWKDNILEPSMSNEFSYIELRKLVQLQDMAAKREIFYGNYKKAIEIYTKIYRLGILVREGAYGLINDMMGSSISTIATNGLAPMIFIKNAPRDLIGETLEMVEKQAPPPVRFIIKHYHEQKLIGKKLPKILEKPGNGSKFQKYLNYRKELNEKAFMKKVSKEYLNISNKEYPRYYYLAGKMDWEELNEATTNENYLKDIKVLFYGVITEGPPRVTANIYFNMQLPYLPRVLFSNLYSLARLRSFRLFNAIEGYRNKYGKNPGSLSDLIPGFIDKISIDPFSGKPLKYIVTDKGPAVYSTGPDKEDNKAEKDLQKDDLEYELTKGQDIIFYLDSNKYK